MNRRTLLKMLTSAPLLSVLEGRLAKAVDASATRPKLAINLTGPSYWTTEFPFSNLAFNASRWRLQVGDAPFTWDEALPPMTENGYPLSIPKGSVLESFLIFTQHRRHLSDRLTVTYDGKGTLDYVRGAELLTRSPGKDEIRHLAAEHPFTVSLTETDPSDPLRNIQVFENGQQGASPFRKPFLERLSGMSAIRFMDWMATNDSEVRRWEDRPRVGQFGRSGYGIAWEYMVDLCNVSGIAPWFTMPHLADDTYIRQFARHVLGFLDPRLDIYVEYSNEVWNSTFGQATYAAAQGKELGLSNDAFQAQLRFYARRTNEIIDIWRNVFGSQQHRIVGVYAAQFANDWTSETILSFEGAKERAGVLAVAPYFGGRLGSPKIATEVAGWSLDRIFADLEREVEEDNPALMRSQAKIAQDYGLRLVAYEGGQHLVGHGGAENNDKLTALFVAANRDPRMGELYRRHLAHWSAIGGDLYALYASMSEPGKWGNWGLLENEDTSSTKWKAIQALLRGNPPI